MAVPRSMNDARSCAAFTPVRPACWPTARCSRRVLTSYNVSPFSAGAYFSKIDCFCFELQVLQPGERVTMPVSFFVEPDIVQDADAKHVPVITLSYTFHETDLPEDYQSDQAAAKDYNDEFALGNL